MSTESPSTTQCTHLNAAGRRCRMAVAPTHDTLCAHHLQQQLASRPDPEAVAAELLDSTGDLNTADRVNVLLANTVRQLAHKRIDRHDALAVGYLAQLLLNTVPGVQKEHQAIRAAQAKQALRKSISESRTRPRAEQPVPQPAPQPVAPQPAAQAVAPQPAKQQPAAPQLAPQLTVPQPAAPQFAAAQPAAQQPAADCAAKQETVARQNFSAPAPEPPAHVPEEELLVAAGAEGRAPA